MSSFLKQAWYAAAWAGDVSQDLFARTILDEHILFYRKIDGTPVALDNRCPHRFAPLSRGKRIGDDVRCGYHGLQYNEMGVCVHNPVGDGRIPKNTTVRKYPVAERNQLLWIWMGEPEAADERLIPDFEALLSDPRYKTKVISKSNYVHVKANYLLIVDNLMDLTHIPTLHADSLAPRFPSIAHGKMEVLPQKRKVDVKFDMLGSRSIFREGLVDQWMDILWEAPSLVVFTAGEVEAGGSRDGVVPDIAVHFTTPETDRTSHYFFFVVNPRALAPGISNEENERRVRHIFLNEDGPMFEACQEMMGTSDLLSLKPVFISADRAAAAVRSTLGNLIAEEADVGNQRSKSQAKIFPPEQNESEFAIQINLNAFQHPD